MVYERARRASVEFGDKVVFQTINTSDRGSKNRRVEHEIHFHYPLTKRYRLAVRQHNYYANDLGTTPIGFRAYRKGQVRLVSTDQQAKFFFGC